ncbi:MAG: hypothetical protein ABW328_01750 [Ilumatobacteraceae bacterium]
MGWDASRPVPWTRLLKEWAIYAAIMSALFILFFRDGNVVAILAGLLVSGPLYLFLGFVLAKFGYQRQTLRGGRDARAARAAEATANTGSNGDGAGELPRPRPPPTRRTSSGPNRPARNKRR